MGYYHWFFLTQGGAAAGDPDRGGPELYLRGTRALVDAAGTVDQGRSPNMCVCSLARR